MTGETKVTRAADWLTAGMGNDLVMMNAASGAMQGKISELVRTERRSGLQAADFLVHLRAELLELKQELERAKRSDLLARALDLPLMEEMADWPADKIHSHGWGSYLSHLLRAVSLARFVWRVEDGTLFKPWAAAEAG